MIAVKIEQIKDFMNKLLNSDCFDSYLLNEATITTYNSFSIDGRINQDFYSNEDVIPYDFSLWKDMRKLCFDLIKGKNPPTFFKFVLHLFPEQAYTLLENGECEQYCNMLQSFVLNIKYDSTGLTLTTATSFQGFLMDKTPDIIWDQALKQFLIHQDISFTQL
ncbi:MAG: DUF5721 family protein [Lachnospiraceae bacterium]